MRYHVFVCACVGAAAHAAMAQDDLFSFSLTESGNPANMLVVTGNNLPDLAEDFADFQGQFASFQGVPLTASVDYAGIEDAISISYDPNGGVNGGELLTITNLLGAGSIAPFDEANGDLGEQLQDFFLEDNPDAIANFLEEVNQQSFIAVTDGNPLATTAFSARYKYDRFGLHADFSPTEVELYNDFTMRDYRRTAEEDRGPGLPPHERSKAWQTRLHVAGSFAETDDFEGNQVEAWVGSQLAFNEHLALAIGGTFSYHQFENADVFNTGLHLDLPIRFIIPRPGDRVSVTWQVTPGVAFNGAGSYEFASGGLLLSGGAVNRVTLNLPRGWSITAAQSFTLHEGQKLSLGDVEFDPGVSQQILKVGGKVAKRLGDKVFVYGGVTWTDFLEDAAVDSFVSPTAGIGFRFRNGGVISVGYEGDLADDFKRHAARVDINIAF